MNVAAENPARLAELVTMWWVEAGKYKVLPLDGSVQQRLSAERPQIARPRKQFVYYPGGAVVRLVHWRDNNPVVWRRRR